MWERLKENKILTIGFVVCMILAAYVSQKNAQEAELAEQQAAAEAAARVEAEKQARLENESSESEDGQESEDAEGTDTSMRLPSGELMYINIA